MSHTDAHRPGWLQYFDDAVPVRVAHDHRDGRCVEETLEYARWQRTRPHRHYWRNCAKYEAIVEECPHVKKLHRVYESPCDRIARHWRMWVAANPTINERLDYPFIFPKHEHTSHVKHDNWPCSCDNDPERPTCYRRYACGYFYYASKVYGDHPNHEDRRLYYHGPERRRTRDSLRDAARDWNANGDTDVEPDTRQHRHSVAWLLW